MRHKNKLDRLTEEVETYSLDPISKIRTYVPGTHLFKDRDENFLFPKRLGVFSTNQVNHVKIEEKNHLSCLSKTTSDHFNFEVPVASRSITEEMGEIDMAGRQLISNAGAITKNRFLKDDVEWISVNLDKPLAQQNLGQYTSDNEVFIKTSASDLDGSLSIDRLGADLFVNEGARKPSFDIVNHCVDKNFNEISSYRYFNNGTEWDLNDREVLTYRNNLVQSSFDRSGFMSESIDVSKGHITMDGLGLSIIDNNGNRGFGNLNKLFNDNSLEIAGNSFFKDDIEGISVNEGITFGNNALVQCSLNDDGFIKTELPVIDGIGHQPYDIVNPRFKDGFIGLNDPNRSMNETFRTDSLLSKSSFINVRSNSELMSTSLGEVLNNDRLQNVIEYGMNKAESFNSIVSDSEIKTEAYFSASTEYSFHNVNITCNYLFLIGGDFTAIQNHFGDNVIEVDGDKFIEINGEKYVKL